MTNFLPSRVGKEKRLRARLYRILALALVLLAFAGIPALRRSASAIALGAAAPIWKGGAILADGLGLFRGYLRDKTALERELALVRAEALRFSEQEVLLRAISIENIDLKAFLGRGQSVATSSIELSVASAGGEWVFGYLVKEPVLALVLSRPVRSLYDTLIIDRGSKDGVKVGAAVFSRGGTVLGVVDTVFGSQARVTLMSAPGKRSAVLLGPEQLAAVAEGLGGGAFRVSIAHGTPISKGDVVQLIHDEPWVIGTVALVKSEEGSALDAVHVKSVVNFNEMKWVVVGDELIPEWVATSTLNVTEADSS